MVVPGFSFLAVLIRLIQCYPRGHRQCNWAFCPACVRCNSRSPANAAGRRFRSIPQLNHDRVADTIETVISRHSLAMLHANDEGDFMVRPRFCRASAIATLAVLSMLSGWNVAAAQDANTPDYEAIIASPDRSDGDRQTDQRRHPVKMLAFIGVRSGMKGLDMKANAGTELLARSVGPTGVVYALDPAANIERFVKDKFDIRAQKTL
jgi:hypothetical protein